MRSNDHRHPSRRPSPSSPDEPPIALVEHHGLWEAYESQAPQATNQPFEPFESLEAYVAFRDDYAQTASREDFAAFLDDNQEYEDEIERRASEGS